ncbi:MAG: aldehyde dehydrogenase [Gammaproteobacteria bacterium]
MQDIQNYIDGKLVAPSRGKYRENMEPATGMPWSRVPESSAMDVDSAVTAAKKAFPDWSAMPAEERAHWLSRLADSIDRHAEKLAEAETRDTGKPIRLARDVEIPRAARNFRFYAAAATQFFSESHAMENDAINYTLRQPLGVVGCISPWNLPLYLFTWKVAPALAAGNCVVSKPSEVTPMTAYLFSEICRDIDFPAGVLNVVHGTGLSVGVPLVEHANIKAVSFTGGTRTGADIAARAAPRFKKLSLELGGKNPNIIFADCDWETMLATTLRSSFSNQGQICLCGSRIYVESKVYERFVAELVQRAKAMRIGDPMEDATEQGAVVSQQQHEKILGCITSAREDGGEIHCGGEPVTVAGRCENGWFIAPTVITGLGPDCRTNQEEIFGPVVTVTPFESEDEVLQLANGTEYGLAASIWSQNISRCHRLAKGIESGLVWVNTWMLRDLRTPMGGMKQSGMGREGGFDSMRFFTEAKNVCIKY